MQGWRYLVLSEYGLIRVAAVLAVRSGSWTAVRRGRAELPHEAGARDRRVRSGRPSRGIIDALARSFVILTPC